LAAKNGNLDMNFGSSGTHMHILPRTDTNHHERKSFTRRTQMEEHGGHGEENVRKGNRYHSS